MMGGVHCLALSDLGRTPIDVATAFHGWIEESNEQQHLAPRPTGRGSGVLEAMTNSVHDHDQVVAVGGDFAIVTREPS